MRVVGWLVIATISAIGGRATADENVTGLLDLEPGSLDPLRLTRTLPADTQIALTIQVGGGDVTRADFEVWPKVDPDCSVVSSTQHQKVGLALGGTAAARTLTATLLPLQLNTEFCFKISYDRPLTANESKAITDKLKALRFDDVTECRTGRERVDAAIASSLEGSTTGPFRTEKSETAGGLREAIQRSSGQDNATCAAILKARSDLTIAEAHTQAAQQELMADQDALQSAADRPDAIKDLTVLNTAATARTIAANLAEPWKSKVLKLADATDRLTAAQKAMGDARAARDKVPTIADALGVAATAAIPTLVSQTRVTISAGFHSVDTTAAASYVSPVAGVIAAFPLISNHKTGFASPWVTPYLGASIYLNAVDRVIALHDLVGSQFCQRFSFTIGVVASSPSINGKSVSGPWSLSVVPMLGAGSRLTQYIHVDGGVILFKYADINPVITDLNWGVAFWGGVSVDADLWAIVSGKLGK